jgi:hypothetical protein
MPHVTTHYRVYVAAGHHRQPRYAAAWIEPNPQSDAEVVPGTTLTPYAPPQLAYLVDGAPQVASFLFWSATDGTNGQTTTNQTLNQTVDGTPMTITAWYLPPGGIGPGESAYIIDAFSDALGDFIDDTFVTVSPDGGLTSDANVVGIVPTANAETLTATNSVHTGESFEQWIGGQPVGDVDNLQKGESGVAIATYHRSNIPPPKVGSALMAWLILFGIIQDGGGIQIPLGGGGPVPVGPWGPVLEQVVRAASVGSMATQMRAGEEIGRLAAGEALEAAKQLEAAVNRETEQG